MAHASKTHMAQGGQGKGTGTGALTELPENLLEENMVLSNRDKSQHSQERGLDGRAVQTEQYHDHAANRRNFSEELGSPTDRNVSGLSNPLSDASGDDSSLQTKNSG